MSTRTTKLAIALSAGLVAATAIAPLASAHDWREEAQPHGRHDDRGRGHGHDATAAWIGLGIAALAGVAIAANAHPEPVYAAPPDYAEPVYAPPVYAQPAPSCTTINGYAACLGPDGAWHYVR